MAGEDADITINDNTATSRKVDTRTVGALSDEHRQVVVIGDPAISTNVATINANGSINIEMSTGTNTATFTTIAGNVTYGTANAQILAVDTARIAVNIFNDYGSSNLNIMFPGAGTQSTGQWSVVIPPGGLYEVPNEMVALKIVGYFTLAAATSVARITTVI